MVIVIYFIFSGLRQVYIGLCSLAKLIRGGRLPRRAYHIVLYKVWLDRVPERLFVDVTALDTLSLRVSCVVTPQIYYLLTLRACPRQCLGVSVAQDFTRLSLMFLPSHVGSDERITKHVINAFTRTIFQLICYCIYDCIDIRRTLT